LVVECHLNLLQFGKAYPFVLVLTPKDYRAIEKIYLPPPNQ